MLILLPWSAQAQFPGVTEVQLSSPQHAGSDVQASNQSLVYSPDGRYVCFIGDTETDNANELWCADTDSGAPAVRVSGILPSGTSVRRPGFNASSDLVFYIAPGGDSSKDDLFMVPPDGSAPPVRLNAPFVPAGADVGLYRYLPETEQLVYTGASQVAGQNQLHVVSIDNPGVVTVLNGPLVAGGDVSNFQLASAAGRVVYLADQQVDGREEIYSVRLDGTGAVKINGPLVSGGSIFSWELSPDGFRVAYIADEDIDGVDELFVSPVTGGGSTKVSGPAVAGGDAWFFTFSPDSQWLLFTGDLAINGWRHFYSTPADGSQATPNVLATQVVQDPDPPVIELSPTVEVTSDGSDVLFASRQGSPSTRRILRAPIDGSAPAVSLTNALTEVNARFQYEPGVDRILVRDAASPSNLYSVAVDGSSFIALTSFTDPLVDISGFSTPNGVVYAADPEVDERASLFFVDYLGQTTTELSLDSEFFRGVLRLFFSPDRASLFFVEQVNSSVIVLSSDRLRVAQLDSLTVSNLASIGNSALVTGDREFLWLLPSPTNPTQVFYLADRLADDQVDAFLVTLTDRIFRDRFE
ncbi:hypothetical protein AY599_08390 [Leptolyngbya valderiana BDU 20041]|nr:hypothetical protein AY599_08390 [Leptolyngbya valderiana BDU 20041]